MRNTCREKQKEVQKKQDVSSKQLGTITPTAPLEVSHKPKLYPTLIDQAWRENPDDETVVVRRRQPVLPVPPPPHAYGEPPGAEGGVEQEEERIGLAALRKVRKDLTELGQNLSNLLGKWIDSQKKGVDISAWAPID